MGQKVNPHGLRVGVIKNWDSRWFAEKGTFGDTLVEDYNVRNFILKELNTRSKNPSADKCVYAGVPKPRQHRTLPHPERSEATHERRESGND